MNANTYLNFAGNTEEASRFYADAFGVELTDVTRIEDMPWGDYWGSFCDRFGVQWVISYTYPDQGGDHGASGDR